MSVIDVHTHMFTARWLELLKKEGGLYNIKTRPDGQQEIFRGDTPVVIPQKGHFDWKLRIAHMRRARDIDDLEHQLDALLTPEPGAPGEEGAGGR